MLQRSASPPPGAIRTISGRPSSPEHVTYRAPSGPNAATFGQSMSPPSTPRAYVSTTPVDGSSRAISPLPASHAYTRPCPSTASPSIDPPDEPTWVNVPSRVTE